MNQNKSNYGNPRRGPEQSISATVNLADVVLTGEKINPELFASIADRTARQIAESCKDTVNKATQLRRFYDEVCLWHEKLRTQPEKFSDYLPFIKMIGAKVAYAKGRNLVDENFYKMMEHCLKQVSDKKSFDLFKTFFEAFMGFYKMHKPK